MSVAQAESKVAKRKRFEDVFPPLVNELTDYLKECGLPQDAQDWFRRNLDYNTPGGKLNRGLSVIDTYEIIQGRPLTEEEYLRAAILGWCIELLQAYFLVADDMMDYSVTRRGQACWYKVEEPERVGLIAINDSFMLQGALYFLLKKHFRSTPYYLHLVELFLEVSFQTELGQLIDLITAPEDRVDLSKFSLERQEKIVLYKTAYYSFYLPVALAMRMSGMKEERSYEMAQKILLPLGIYFQVQDDYLDAYGDPEMIGKVGTDIKDNKCGWNINVALQLASPEQRRVLDDNYGRKDDQAEARVKAVFEELRIPDHYQKYEAEAYERITTLINAIPAGGHGVEPGLKREIFTTFLAKIYKVGPDGDVASKSADGHKRTK